ERAAWPGANGFTVSKTIIEGQKASDRLAFEGTAKLNEVANGMDGFLGIGIDVYLLPYLKIVETESHAVIVRQWVTQFEDGEVSNEGIFQGATRKGVVHGSAVVIWASGQVAFDDLVPVDFAGPHVYGDMVIGSNKAAFRVHTEARTEVGFFA